MLFFLQKIKTYYLCLILTSFLDCVFREILGSVLKPPFLCKCCSAIRREEVCKQVGCERERLTLYINNTNFPLINMQQLKHIIFQNLLNEPRTKNDKWCMMFSMTWYDDVKWWYDIVRTQIKRAYHRALFTCLQTDFRVYTIFKSVL